MLELVIQIERVRRDDCWSELGVLARTVLDLVRRRVCNVSATVDPVLVLRILMQMIQIAHRLVKCGALRRNSQLQQVLVVFGAHWLIIRILAV